MQRPIRFKRIRVRITRSGWLYIGLTLIVGVAAVNSANNLLYLITAGLLALMSLSGMIAYLALRGLELGVTLPREWFAGQQLALTLTVTNTRRHLPSFLLNIAAGGEELLIPEVPARDQAEGFLPFRFERRGIHPLGDVVITSSFPFAFFHRGGTLPLACDVVVYPAPLVPDRTDFYSHMGAEAGVDSWRLGVGGDFRGTRPYADGDSRTRINWKAWARLGGLVVNEFEEESAPPLLLSLDSVPGPTIEHRLSQLTGLVLEAHRYGRRVGLSLPGQTIEPGSGIKHRQRQLSALALFEN